MLAQKQQQQYHQTAPSIVDNAQWQIVVILLYF